MADLGDDAPLQFGVRAALTTPADQDQGRPDPALGKALGRLGLIAPGHRNRELFYASDCRKHLASAARLITERRACIPGRRVSSVQHGNAAVPMPPATGDLASALAP